MYESPTLQIWLRGGVEHDSSDSNDMLQNGADESEWSQYCHCILF